MVRLLSIAFFVVVVSSFLWADQIHDWVWQRAAPQRAEASILNSEQVIPIRGTDGNAVSEPRSKGPEVFTGKVPEQPAGVPLSEQLVSNFEKPTGTLKADHVEPALPPGPDVRGDTLNNFAADDSASSPEPLRQREGRPEETPASFPLSNSLPARLASLPPPKPVAKPGFSDQSHKPPAARRTPVFWLKPPPKKTSEPAKKMPGVSAQVPERKIAAAPRVHRIGGTPEKAARPPDVPLDLRPRLPTNIQRRRG